MPRPVTDPALVARAVELVQGGESVDDAAREVGISPSTVERGLRRARAAAPVAPLAPAPLPAVPPPTAPAPRRRAAAKPKAPTPRAPASEPVAPPPGVAAGFSPAPATPPIDVDGDPLDIARAMLAANMAQVANLAIDSPRLNPARAEGRALLKLVAALEEARGKVETPEEAERRRRREDAETRKRIERYLLEYEADAAQPREGAPFGVCLHCGAPRAAS